MYADGMVGNRAIFDSLAPITAGVFNYMRSENSAPYKQDSIFPWVNEYWDNPDNKPTSKELSNNALLSFLSQAPGFDMQRFKQ